MQIELMDVMKLSECCLLSFVGVSSSIAVLTDRCLQSRCYQFHAEIHAQYMTLIILTCNQLNFTQ